MAERFTVLVEAKDHGEVVSLSSSTTVIIHVQDGNNHLPTISGHTVSGHLGADHTLSQNSGQLSGDLHQCLHYQIYNCIKICAHRAVHVLANLQMHRCIWECLRSL